MAITKDIDCNTNIAGKLSALHTNKGMDYVQTAETLLLVSSCFASFAVDAK